MIFKIYGERNSGTNYLTQLLESNFGKNSVYVDNSIPVMMNSFEILLTKHWKHGLPDSKLKSSKVVDIIIFRDLHGWLKSMFYNPYHLVPDIDFNNFLLKPQESNELIQFDYTTKTPINNDDNHKTIFDIRYYKMYEYLNYFSNNDNVILVNLNFIQHANQCIYFLSEINRIYGLNITQFYLQENHTKSGENRKNRNYNINIDDYKNVINSKKKADIETIIDNLSFVIKTTDIESGVGLIDIDYNEGFEGALYETSNNADNYYSMDLVIAGFLFIILLIFIVLLFR